MKVTLQSALSLAKEEVAVGGQVELSLARAILEVLKAMVAQ